MSTPRCLARREQRNEANNVPEYQEDDREHDGEGRRHEGAAVGREGDSPYGPGGGWHVEGGEEEVRSLGWRCVDGR